MCKFCVVVQPSPSRPASGTAVRNSSMFGKFCRGCIIPSLCKRSEAFLEIRHLRRLGAKMAENVGAKMAENVVDIVPQQEYNKTPFLLRKEFPKESSTTGFPGKIQGYSDRLARYFTKYYYQEEKQND